MPRYLAVLSVGSISWLLTVACVYSLAGWEGGDWFYDLDYLARLVLPLSALLVGAFMSWFAAPVVAEDFTGTPSWAYASWLLALRWLALPALAVAGLVLIIQDL